MTATPGPRRAPVDLRNVQVLVANRVRRPITRHLLFRFGTQDDASRFLGDIAPHVSMSDVPADTAPDPLLVIGLTFNGLTEVGVDPAVLDTFDAIFKAGPDPQPLGDATGSRSDPVNWWEGQFRTDQVHCVVQVHARSDDAIDDATRLVRSLAQHRGVAELIPRQDGSVLESRSLGRGRLHFGYTDGISHVDVRWEDGPTEQGEVDFREFVLGYSTSEHSSAPHSGAGADLVRDGCYAAFRWIYQDVAAFNRFLRAEGPGLFPELAGTDAEELLAAKLMGRWRDGSPLVLAPERPDPKLAAATTSRTRRRTRPASGVRCPRTSGW
jgi:deferrochelatase/peroxidase EfeB